jgi:hypothetical protein
VLEKNNVTSSGNNDVHDFSAHTDDTIPNSDANKEVQLSELSLHVTAAALRRMALVSVTEKRATQQSSQNDDSILRKDVLSRLLKSVGSQLVAAHRLHHFKNRQQEEDEMLDVYALCDVLQALAILSKNGSSKDKMIPLSSIVIDLMNSLDKDSLYTLGPIRLVQCLQAMATLQMGRSHSSSVLLQAKIYERLLKPDAVSMLPAKFLAHGLSSLASIEKNEVRVLKTCIDDQCHEKSDDIKMLARAFMRRLRKQKVIRDATMDDLTRALVATSDLVDLGAMTGMEDETAIFGFSSLRRVLELHHTAIEHNGESELTTEQVVDLIASWSVLTDSTREDTVIDQLLQVCVEEDLLRNCSVDQLVSIFHAVQKIDVANHVELTAAVGEQLLRLASESKTSDRNTVRPNSIREILRWPTLTNRRNKKVLRPYLDASSILFTDDSFLAGCSVGEISNFLWFLSSAHSRDDDVLLHLGTRLMDPDVVDDCSPKMASRILAAFTSLVESGNMATSDKLMEMKRELFHKYGGHLLSSSLSPAEISSSLHAYAKANYLQDMGIFDHLVNLLASSRHECSTRQLSQSLWSCGKMIAWERMEVNEEGIMSEQPSPPYLPGAMAVAEELSGRVEELSSSDIAQTIWALGKLGLQEHFLISSFAHVAIEHSTEFTSGQITNILWGMAQTEHNDPRLISTLLDQLTSQHSHPSSKEAASALFSLGKLNWKDEVVFDHLSQAMINQIEDTNAQSITNALWAYRTVHLPPPQSLLDTWAIEKLGLHSVNMQVRRSIMKAQKVED